MPRLPAVKKSAHTRLRATFWPASGLILDLRPLAFEFFGDHWQGPSCALAHLGARDADGDGLVGMHHPRH